MKYLIIIFLFLISNLTLIAQDTLYVKGARKPLIVNITIVKKNSLNYTKEEGGFIYTVKMKNVRKIAFKTATRNESFSSNGIASDNSSSAERVYPDFEEFRSTISVNSIGTGRYHLGLNYLYNIDSKSEYRKYFFNIGGGYYRRRVSVLSPVFGSFNFVRAKGYYIEFGARLEVKSKKRPQNRFHIGLEVNNRWIEIRTSNPNSFPAPQETEVANKNEFNIQIPIGYTLRTDEGFYFNTGLELTTEKIFPAIHAGIGFAFGR